MRKICFAILVLAGILRPADKPLPLRWFYLSSRLRADQELDEIRQLARTASENGLNGVLFAGGLDSIDLQPPDYLARLQKVKAIFDEYHIEMIPSIFSVGYGDGILARDKNLAEGLPVKDAVYVAHASEARLDPEVPVADGGSVADGVWTREVTIRPYRCYRVTFRAKTAGLAATRAFSTGSFRLDVRTEDLRNLTPWNARVPPTTDWMEVRWGFNSLWYDKVKISIGAPNAGAGKAWVDHVRVEEVGLLNVLRRQGTPVTVRNDQGDTVFEEGRDYGRIEDAHLNFRFDHEGPVIRILPGSRIRNGERLRVSYYHGFSINDGQTSICMGEPKTYEIWREMARRMHEAVAPPRYVLSMDEVREGGTCEACRGRGMAKLLGECLTRQFQILHEVNPKADVWVWSDMLDPHHNAHGNYYLVDGDYNGSWRYIPKEMGILTWYYERRAQSLPFFSNLGFRTVAGAYYDADSLDNPRGWLEELIRTPNAQGIMYTTWLHKYALLADFGKLVSK